MIQINHEICIGCALCVKDCFAQALTITPDGKAEFCGNCIQCAHCVAVCPTGAVHMTDHDQDPPHEALHNAHDALDPDLLLLWLRSRRSMRAFQSAPVEEEKLMQILEAGRCAPTAANMQNVRFILITEQLDHFRAQALKSLDLQARQYLEQGVKPLSSLNYLSMWTEMYSEYLADPNAPDRLTFGAPAVLLIISPSDVNGSLAAADMRLMADALGLGSVYSGFICSSAKDPEVAEFLRLKPGENIVTALVIGYPAVSYQRTAPRKALHLTRL